MGKRSCRVIKMLPRICWPTGLIYIKNTGARQMKRALMVLKLLFELESARCKKLVHVINMGNVNGWRKTAKAKRITHVAIT